MKHLLLAATALAAVAAVPVANASVMTITLDEPTFANLTTPNSLIGAVSVGPISYGTYSVNQVSGQDRTALAVPGVLNANSINVSSAALGDLTVGVHSTGMTGQGVVSAFSSFAVNALNGGITSVDESTFVNGVLVATHTFTSLGTFTQTDVLDLGLGGTFSADDIFVLHNTTGAVGNANLTIDLSGAPVPEPASLALLGVGLLGLGMVARKR